jgi:DNA mismatch repair protein MutS2
MSSTMNAVAPTLVAEPRVSLDRAYHPYLLWQLAQGEISRAVPLSVTLDARRPLMIVTGPNTGGKTVMLRTIGLLVAMAHCGLHVPAEGECTIGTFAALVLSVGDRQSLLHQLSTFAAHVETLKSMLAEADAATLVLLDELGTGTDPDEGAALAMAVLEELGRRGTLGVVTTHLPRLKGFADANPGVVNASMRFDDALLEPAYELVVGAPGRSLGLLIAERRGMPREIVARARALLGEHG